MVAREQWCIGLRSVEERRYPVARNFFEDEQVFCLEFQAVQARTRCMEFDQVSVEELG
jgi:hypothetical protein